MLAWLLFNRCRFLRLAYLWPKCKQFVPRIPGALFRTTLMFSVNAVVNPLEKHSIVELMSSKTLIQNASSITVTSVNQLLVLSATVLIEHHENYRSSIENVLVLMEEMLTYINSEPHQEELWVEMVAARAKIEDTKKEMQTFMDYVEKLVTAAAEAAYLAGSEFPSTTLCESFGTTQQKLSSEQNKTKELEQEYNRKQQALIKIMSEKGKLSNGEDFLQELS